MSQGKKEVKNKKQGLHPRNKHQGQYDFKALKSSYPELSDFIKPNAYHNESIDFADPKAVKALNKALLFNQYDVKYWDIPQNYLCPPIPGRADYIHHLADLLGKSNAEKTPVGKKIVCMDIGVGANCIYPIVGVKEYGWSFIGTDIDQNAIKSANKIIDQNPFLNEQVEIRHQPRKNSFFNGILKKGEKIDVSICNPPFHTSYEAAQAGSLRKVGNLKGKKVSKAHLNFGGRSNELWCKGGEKQFIGDMIYESKKCALNCLWFSTLVSKESNLKSVYASLKRAKSFSVKTLDMGQGNKISRVVAWTFQDQKQQKVWQEKRFNS